MEFVIKIADENDVNAHKGSVGNLCLEGIRENFNEVYDKFEINENFR